MRITPSEALAVISALSERARVAQDAAEAAVRDRDSLIAELDGQEGMVRSAMADAAGVHRSRIFAIVQAQKGHPIREDDGGHQVSDALADAIRDVFTRFDGQSVAALAEQRYRESGSLEVHD